jgi:anti-sigma B factor antagonist
MKSHASQTLCTSAFIVRIGSKVSEIGHSRRQQVRRRSLSITESTPTPGLSVSVVGSGGDALVCLSGRLSIDSSPGVRDQLLAILDQESLPTLTIDLAEVTYIDVSGIATLVEALKIARARKTTVRLRGLHDRPRYLLEVTGLLHLFANDRPHDSSASKVL